MFKYKPHIIDTTLPPAMYGQTAVADIDNDGKLEFITRQQKGTIYYYKYNSPDSWDRFALGENSPSDVGGIAFDVDGDSDGDIDLFSCEMEDIRGEETPKFYIWESVDGKGLEWKKHVIFGMNIGGHAALMADFTGNGLPDIITRPWQTSEKSALNGGYYTLFLENLGKY